MLIIIAALLVLTVKVSKIESNSGILVPAGGGH